MIRRCRQYIAHVAALGIARTDAIRPIGEHDISIEIKVNDHFGFR